MPLAKSALSLLSAAILGFSAASLATTAFAANWVYVGEAETGTIVFYDFDTIQRSGNHVTVWQKKDYSLNKAVKLREIRERMRYDCAERTSTQLNGVGYYPDGRNQYFNNETWQQTVEPVVPQTMGEATLNKVCAVTAP